MIARAQVEQALIRLIGRVKEFKGMTLDEVLAKKDDRKIFVLPDGRAVKSFHTTFGWVIPPFCRGFKSRDRIQA